MDCKEIQQQDYDRFHQLANAYYREGEDVATPQEEIDSFIRFLFEKVISREISGCFTILGGKTIGFALWALDTPDFAFSQMPGLGTILEIGVIPGCRGAGHGKELVAFVEHDLHRAGMKQCYVTAYGPAEPFWCHCGYEKNGSTATNGLPIMMKNI